MPYNRPGTIAVDVIATKVVAHNALCYEAGAPGLAIKTLTPGAYVGLDTTPQIEIGEAFNMILKGEVQVTNPGGFVRGDPVYMTIATNALTETGPASATVARVGVVSEVAGVRGVPTGMMRVNLDLKDTLL